MRKYLLLYMMLFWLPMVARGQTITDLADIDLSGLPQPTKAKALRYWFDDDATSVQTVASIGVQTLDVSTLNDGLHTIHYQVISSDNQVCYVTSAIFLKNGSNTGSETLTASKLMYWFDDETSIQYVDVTGGAQLLDASELKEGLHTIHYQVLCNNGQMTPALSSIFLRIAVDAETAIAKSLRYWFDDEQSATELGITEGVQLLDASGLIEGLHTVHYQIANSNGTLGAPASSIFLKMNWETASTTAKSLRYWFDDEQTATETAITDGIQLMDASRLTDGLHTVHYQIANSNGTLGTPASSIFLKMNSYDTESTTAQSLRYWFDDDTDVKTTSVSGGTQSIDVSNLLSGLHTLHYQLVDSSGQVTSPVSCVFMKSFDKAIADGENRITKYQYWLNRNSQAMQRVELASAANPYTLISLLPMQKEPIQSSQFHFEVTNDVPTIFAKNTLHVRFYDARSYFVDDSKDFIDYSVKQEVEPVGELQATQTFPKVGVNDIKWYTMPVAPGDTAAFRLSQAATVQVFAPSGMEVFKTSESASVKWAGIHTWEDGTYYVAVHDVTGSKKTMTLDYMHMDKYDVVEWDVHTVGNGGCSTITFKGNGFRDLYAVDLYTVKGDTIHSIDVSHDSDAETAVTFDFSGANLGVYHAVFHFTQEDRLVSRVVTVEEAVDIELASTASFPRSFLRGTSTTYTVSLTNKGNMTAYAVPIIIKVSSRTTEGISYLSLSGLGLKSLYEIFAETESLDESNNEELLAVSNQIGEDHYFLKERAYDNERKDSITIRSNTFYTAVSPNSTKIINLTARTAESIEVWVSIPNEWNAVYSSLANNIKGIRKESTRKSNFYCCHHEQMECAADMLGMTLDMASTGLLLVTGGSSLLLEAGSCATSVLSTLSSFTSQFVCDKQPLWSLSTLGNAISAIGTAASCGAFRKIKNATEIVSTMVNSYAVPASFMNCGNAGKKKPGCPIPTNGGSSTPQPPSDPNDIYGFLSESGTHFIADSVARVNYTIEFENDTAFATAAAHTIVIRDTLDGRYFDLENFMPTAVRIGAKEEQLAESEVYSSKGVTSFVKTIDMRPEINAIAQVEGEYSWQTGIAEWRFTSLDPMTMEPTDDLMQGILPVNYDGTSGIGEVMFEIGVKPNKGDGTEIANRAGIVFDYEEAILTPTWVNTVDAVAPASTILGGIQRSDSTLTLRLAGEDERSGVWKYSVYAQMGDGASWEPVAENTTDTLVDVRIYDGIEYGFLVLATDSAGNAERKSFEEADFQLTTVTPGDANGDGTVDALDVVLVTSYYLGGDVYLNLAAADVNADGEVNSLDVVAIQNIYLNATNGSGKVLAPRRRRMKNE